MKITSYFIKHPVAAIILNATIIMIGILSFYNLVIREYPDVISPKLIIETSFPNASSELVESSITNILEDELAGVEGVDNIFSSSDANLSRITIDFLVGTSMDQALIAVKDAIGIARDRLPKEVKEPIVRRANKNSGPPFMAVCLESDAMSFGELTHYANISLKNILRSTKGVSSVGIWGRDYTYKVVLDHKEMYKLGVNADEVLSAIIKNGMSLPVGKFNKEVSIALNTSLETAEDIENILVQNNIHPVFLKDIAKIKLESQNEDFRLNINGSPGLCMGISRAQDANPLDVSNSIHNQVNHLKNNIPENIKIQVSLDQAEFIRSSIDNIKSSILEAMIFVAIIVFIFLRNIRATIIPIVTIPIALIGSLFFLKVFGFSINIITLLAMVLAVGLVVDDAIVVLENISRHLGEGETPVNAAIKGAKEIGFAVVAMTLTLTSVYAPIVFISGITGQLFIEFAVALAGSVIISGITAITLSPLMCAHFLKAKHNNLMPQIDMFLEKISMSYARLLKMTMSYNKLIIGFLILSMLVILTIFKLLPSETAPKEDRSLIGISIPSISGKGIDHTEVNVAKVENMVKDIPEAQGIMSFIFAGGGSVILPLKPIEQRTRSAAEIVDSLRTIMSSLPSMDAWPWSWDNALPGVDNVTENSELQLVISTTDSYLNLLNELNKVRDMAEKDKLFSSIYHDLNLDSLGYNIDIDKNILAKLHLTEEQVAKMVEVFFSGNSYARFKKDGILYPITVEGDFNPWSLNELYVTNFKGNRISIGSFAKFTNKQVPSSLYHYNQMRAANLKVHLNMGDDLEDSMNKLYSIVDNNIPSEYKKTWAGVAKSYNDSSLSIQILFFLALLFIYAILSLQFDNFVDPLIILFTVPLACSGALLAMYFTGVTLNIYSQVGLITLIGLITKHGILIVEFANQLHKKGCSLMESIEHSAALRFRPILMTTGAMIAGSIPLTISTSAGSEARHAIGIVLVFGLGIGTFFTLFMLPNLCYLIKSLTKKD